MISYEAEAWKDGENVSVMLQSLSSASRTVCLCRRQCIEEGFDRLMLQGKTEKEVRRGLAFMYSAHRSMGSGGKIETVKVL